MSDERFDTNVEGLRAALADRYVIERELGQGGMATVFLAHDVRHDRKVALKVLKPELGAIVGGDRFLAEIRTTANLQHPNILPLFDSGESDGMLFYVMPYIEGESLRERIDREKQLAIGEAVSIASKVADALDYAHEHGVVHRDIKPANILVTARGEPLVADFGIALAVSQAGGGRITETGLSLGTPHYMSPEQATGDRDIDPRSDIYALGCVLYEMLAGQPPFAAPTAQGVLVRILTEHPRSISDFRHTVPPHVAGVLARSLEKLPADRFPSAAELKAALADETYRYTAVPQPTGASTAATASEVVPHATGATHPGAGPPPSPVLLGALAVAAVATVAAVLGWARSTPEPPPPAPPMRAEIDLGGADLVNISSEIVISPDGSRLAAPFGEGGGNRLARSDGIFIRNSSDADFRLIPGTEGAVHTSFSPDSKWLVYSDRVGLHRVSVDGGAPQPVLQPGTLTVWLPSWSRGGWIYFGSNSGLHRIRDTGGQPEVLMEGVFAYGARALPGDRKVLFSTPNPAAVRILDLETDSSRVLVPDAVDPTYVEELGQLLWVDLASALWAAPFDAQLGEITGPPSLVLDGISSYGQLFARYSVSRQGTLVYSSGGGGAGAITASERLVVYDLEGSEEVIELDPRNFNSPRWAPDGRRIAYDATPVGSTDGDPDIYVYDVELQQTPRRLTNEGVNLTPVWSPDGLRIVFSSNREGTDGTDLFIRDLESDAPPELLVSLPGGQFATDWPEDDLIVFENGSPSSVSMVELGDSVTVREYYAPEADVDDLVVSPDGSIAAYTSDESGQDEVYIRSFPEPRAETVVSEGGGLLPYWGPDGESLFYYIRPDEIWRATLELEPTPTVVSRERVRTLVHRGMHLHPDGDRVIAVRLVGDDPTAEGTEAPVERHFVVTNWFEELRARTGGSGGNDR